MTLYDNKFCSIRLTRDRYSKDNGGIVVNFPDAGDIFLMFWGGGGRTSCQMDHYVKYLPLFPEFKVDKYSVGVGFQNMEFYK